MPHRCTYSIHDKSRTTRSRGKKLDSSEIQTSSSCFGSQCSSHLVNFHIHLYKFHIGRPINFIAFECLKKVATSFPQVTLNVDIVTAPNSECLRYTFSEMLGGCSIKCSAFEVFESNLVPLDSIRATRMHLDGFAKMRNCKLSRYIFRMMAQLEPKTFIHLNPTGYFSKYRDYHREDSELIHLYNLMNGLRVIEKQFTN